MPPDFEREPRMVALRHPTEYPMNEGRIVSTDGLDLAPTGWRDAFQEDQVAWSQRAAGPQPRRPGLPRSGPSSRITLAGRPAAPDGGRRRWPRTGLAGEIRTNPYRSIVARAVELVDAVAEAIDIVEAYQPPGSGRRRRGRPARHRRLGHRGAARHALPRYELDEQGRIADARIVPPTSQNQAAIEADLTIFAPQVLGLPHGPRRPIASSS